ncbi:MspA family porin [Nocardia noduli]|uniref:MspA family porin n=1 Tax=Nocardia noduli TaxID=2815722 RepID=UPI001C2146B3|nr:MspA family porin [Nocardia noduli]
MNRKPSYVLVLISTVIIACTGLIGATAGAAPGEVAAGGLHIVAAVDSNSVVPAGDIAMNVPFVHSVKVSGDFSVVIDGAALRGGEIVAGYLIGCAVDISNGISVGISPSVAVGVGIAPSVGVDFGVDLGLEIDAPPTVGIGAGVSFAIQPSIEMETGLAGELAVNLAPGTVTAAVIGATELDSEVEFPYTFAHSNTPLSVNGCISPASAMPFVTVRADARNATAQTTGYGAAFGF